MRLSRLGLTAVKICVYTPSPTAFFKYWKELNARVLCGDRIFQQITLPWARSFVLFTSLSHAMTRQPLAGPKDTVEAAVRPRGRLGSPTERPGTICPFSGSSSSTFTRLRLDPVSSTALPFALTFGLAFSNVTFSSFTLALALALAKTLPVALLLGHVGLLLLPHLLLLVHHIGVVTITLLVAIAITTPVTTLHDDEGPARPEHLS
mmetsp:Transcript_120525/g.286329  ORF Transcript_120525/g.286329 Transcript_120525/m.286329 type:complete len:206 (-) Transcript_120525:8-625(-)